MSKATKKPATKKATTAKPAKAKTPKADKPKRVSALDASAQVLGSSKLPMNCQELITMMAEKGLWSSPNGKTPHATLYAAICREIKVKGAESRFKKAKRGKFTTNG
jgi:hypothetical protein